MNQLTIVHEKQVKSTNNNQKQIVSNEPKQELEYENKREDHGKNIALTRNVFRIEDSDTFYVQSERSNEIYYFVRYNPDVFEYCSCLDNSTRHVKCKHLHACEFAIKLGTLKDIEKLPEGVKRYPEKISAATIAAVKAKSSYLEDDYDF